LELAKAASKAVTLAVVKINPALSFYSEAWISNFTDEDKHKFHLCVDPRTINPESRPAPVGRSRTAPNSQWMALYGHVFDLST